jgi:hypothetical protein
MHPVGPRARGESRGPLEPQIANVFIGFLWALIAAIIVRSLLTWFPWTRATSLCDS